MADLTSDPNCIFCKIVAGAIPSYKLYEDENILSFLDIGPLSHGHCLIIPKAHYVTINQMPDSLAGACMSLVPRLSRALVSTVDVDAWNVLQNNGKLAGQAVDHVHFHIIPRKTDDGLGFRWPAGQLDPGEADKLVEAITAHLD